MEKGLNITEVAETALENDIANIISKSASGKTLTSRERRLLESVAAGREAGAKRDYARNMVELAECLGITRQALYKWKRKKGAPKALPNGSYRVEDWVIFAKKNGLSCACGADSGDTEEGDSLQKLRERLLRVDIEHRELITAIKKGKYVPFDLVSEVWSAHILKMRSILESKFLNELPPLLCAHSAIEIRQEMEKALREAFGEVSAAMEKLRIGHAPLE